MRKCLITELYIPKATTTITTTTTIKIVIPLVTFFSPFPLFIRKFVCARGLVVRSVSGGEGQEVGGGALGVGLHFTKQYQ